jgi:hypothetical protein
MFLLLLRASLYLAALLSRQPSTAFSLCSRMVRDLSDWGDAVLSANAYGRRVSNKVLEVYVRSI